MAGDLQAGFSNHINVIQIRTSGSSSQRVTDRAVDVNGDGNDEQVVVSGGTQIGTSNKYNPPATVTKNTGAARTVLSTDVESDGGVDTTGSEFTEGTA